MTQCTEKSQKPPLKTCSRHNEFLKYESNHLTHYTVPEIITLGIKVHIVIMTTARVQCTRQVSKAQTAEEFDDDLRMMARSVLHVNQCV